MEQQSMQALNRLSVAEYKASDKLPLVVVLDNVRSGLNVGSVFRTADAFAVQQVVLCGITACPPHREILKTALGSTESVDWMYMDTTVAALAALKAEGYQVWAVEQTDEKTWLQDFVPQSGERYALVLGNEVDGVSAAALAYCDGAIEIPQFGAKHSLNIAVAAGVVVWELAKRYRV
jgi:23S rRNA (guanosine2251-2'-O)-methyltransferase